MVFFDRHAIRVGLQVETRVFWGFSELPLVLSIKERSVQRIPVPLGQDPKPASGRLGPPNAELCDDHEVINIHIGVMVR